MNTHSKYKNEDDEPWDQCSSTPLHDYCLYCV